MLLRLVTWLARKSYGRLFVDSLTRANQAMSGHRTEIVLALEVLIYVLRKLGVLHGELGTSADAFATALLGALPVTIAEKAKKAQEIADGVAPTPE